jgi:hypothetical protein
MNGRLYQYLCRTARLSLTFLLMTALVSAETRKQKLWRFSVGVLVAASIADVSTSWNRPEANPLLQGPGGRFGAQGVALKGALVGSVLLSQHLLMKKKPAYERAATFTNFSMAAFLGATAVHNQLQQH